MFIFLIIAYYVISNMVVGMKHNVRCVFGKSFMSRQGLREQLRHTKQHQWNKILNHIKIISCSIR